MILRIVKTRIQLEEKKRFGVMQRQLPFGFQMPGPVNNQVVWLMENKEPPPKGECHLLIKQSRNCVVDDK